MAIGGYVLVVLFQGAGETVVSGSVGYEVEEVCGFWMHGGFEGAFSWIADGAGGQAGETIGVIGRVYGQVGMMEASLVGTGQQLRVNDTGIGIERHVLREAVV